MTRHPTDHTARTAFSSMRLAHVALRVTDGDAAAAWYGEKLDMRIARSFAVNGMIFTQMDSTGSPSFQIELVSGGVAENRPGDGSLGGSFGQNGWHHLGLWVDDVDGTVSTLKGRSVPIILEPTDNTDQKLRVAFFTDPFGNVIELMQDLDA